jgi:hypothetical protein
MTKRRDQFVLVAAPNKAFEAEAFLKDWLRELDGHPGYLGGAVLKESAGELLEDTYILAIEFESTEAAKALWPKIEGKPTPIEPDTPGVQSVDQGGTVFEWILARGDDHHDEVGRAATKEKLEFNRGRGLFARLIHAHGEVLDEYVATGAGPTADAIAVTG